MIVIPAGGFPGAAAVPHASFRGVIATVNVSQQANPGAPGRNVVFFDGTCGVCDRLVAFALKRDRRRRLFFAPLQGSTARALLPPSVLAGDLLSTVLVLTEGRVLLSRSRAVRYLLRQLGRGWFVLGVLMALVPVAIGDAAYGLFARHRHRFLGPPRCGLLAPADRIQLLD